MRLSPNYHGTPQTKAERNRDAFRFLVLRYQRSIFKYFDQKTRQM